MALMVKWTDVNNARNRVGKNMEIISSSLLPFYKLDKNKTGWSESEMVGGEKQEQLPVRFTFKGMSCP